MDASTTGSAQHKIKTINVEVNLLDAWAIQRVELESKAFRKLTLLAGIAVLATILMPLLSSLGTEKAKRLAQVTASLQSIQHEKQELESRVKVAEPSIAMEEMVNHCHQISIQFFDELAGLVRSSSNDMYFDQLQTEITGGECSIKVIANAASQESGREFVTKAGQGSNVISSTQTSVHQGTMTENSIKFDYIKKVRLGS